MSRCLLEPSESLRLCFRSNLPGRWTLGQPVAITVALENEAGVRVGHPHSQHVWNEPESAAAREGLAAGIPLHVALEGKGASQFLLDVSGDTSAGSGGGAGAHHGNALVLNLRRGTAKGSVTILSPSRRVRGFYSGRHDERSVQGPFSGKHEERAISGSSAEQDARRECCQAEARADVDSEEESREISLLITLMPAWLAKFNRPVLPLGSLPARIVPSPALRYPLQPALPPPPAPPPRPVSAPTPGKNENGRNKRRHPSQGKTDVPVWAVRDGACNLRRLRFLVSDRVVGGRGCAQQPKYELLNTPIGDISHPPMDAFSTFEDDFSAVGDENDNTNNAGTVTRYLKPSANPLKPLPPPEATSAAAASATVATERAAAAAAAEANSNVCCGSNNIARDSSNASDNVIEISAVESVSLGGFFGTVWDCSLALGAFLASLGPGAMRGKKIVELGAGCGAVSALCVALGASEVVATDARDLIPLLKLNLSRNCCAGAVNVKVQEYDWGSPVRDLPCLALGNFDVILCSDLLYDPTGWGPLMESLRQLTGGDGSVVYIAHRTRNVQEREFFSAFERGAESKDGQSFFRCRKLLVEEGGGTGLREERQGQGQGQEGSGSCSGGGVLWGRGYFPDVALYELSPIRPVRA